MGPLTVSTSRPNRSAYITSNLRIVLFVWKVYDIASFIGARRERCATNCPNCTKKTTSLFLENQANANETPTL